MLTLAYVLAGIATLVHVHIFRLESLAWTEPRTRAVFGTTPETAQVTRPMAYNQGFYNLFLAIGAFIGAGLVAAGASGSPLHVAGWTLIFSCCGSMLLAAAVLALSGRKYLRPAVLQGTTPLLAVVLGVLAVTAG